jgi:hypothetical protein
MNIENETETTAINLGVIEGLRALADFLEAHPDLPPINWAAASARVDTKDVFIAAARPMGSFKKVVNDYDYELVRKFGPVKLDVSIRRETICKKVVKWECPDDPFLAITADTVDETSDIPY